jgi:Ca2+-dependent lipid-binding protein
MIRRSDLGRRVVGYSGLREDSGRATGVAEVERVGALPLSEDEQRILHEIERSFYERDRDIYERLSSETIYRHAGRNLKWTLVGFVAGLVVLVVNFASSIVLGFVGFLIMLSCAMVFTTNARKMGKAGWQEVSNSIRAKGLADSLAESRRRLRERFRRD